jgi:tight adherence protein B
VDIDVMEVGFMIVVMVSVLAVILAIRARADRRQQSALRLREIAGESGVGLSALEPPSPGVRSRVDEWFDTAVRRSGLDASPAGVVAVMLLMATIFGAGLYLWKEQLWLAGLGIVVGVLVPLAIVTFYYRRYRRELQDQLPDAFRMLAGSVRAGQTLEQAITFYAQRGVKPLADEFGYAAGLMQLGMGPAAALQSTAARVKLLDFDLLVSTVGLYTQTGGNLILLLERLADSVRDRNQFHGQFFAATAQSRVVAIAIGIAAPLLLLVYVLAEPDHVQAFLASTTGWSLLALCAALEIIGVIWLWRILKVDY